jgi:hypothetical protein
MLKNLFVATLLLAATPLFAADDLLWKLNDPRGDDYGNGKLTYPMNADYEKGDLDLVSVAAWKQEGGTAFEVTFARPIRKPERRTIDGIGTQLNQVAKHGFYTFNVDLYVDTDGLAGSGSTTMLPGRGVMIDPSTGWEKAISLTPDPQAARDELRRIVVRDERRREQAEGKKGIIDDTTKAELQGGVDEFVYFPDQIRIRGNTVTFFVPDSFLGVPQKEWRWVIAVSGADVIERLDQRNRVMRREDPGEALMILPVGTGRPQDRFGGALENDDYMPPLVDVIVPAGQDQKKVLSDYDADTGRPAILQGVKP